MKIIYSILVFILMVFVSNGISVDGYSGNAMLLDKSYSLYSYGIGAVSMVEGIDAVKDNPAGVGLTEYHTLGIDGGIYGLDMKGGSISYVHSIAEKGMGFGVSIYYFTTGEFDNFNENGELVGKISQNDIVFTIAGGKRINENLSTGVGLKYLSDSKDSTSGSAFSANAGIIYKKSFGFKKEGIDGLSLGGCVKNAIGKGVLGGDLLRTFILGAAVKYKLGPMKGDVRVNAGIDYSKADFVYSFGALYNNSFKGISYGSSFLNQSGMIVGVSYKKSSQVAEGMGLSGLSFGIGFTYAGTTIRYGLNLKGNILGTQHNISISYRLGSGGKYKAKIGKKKVEAEASSDETSEVKEDVSPETKIDEESIDKEIQKESKKIDNTSEEKEEPKETKETNEIKKKDKNESGNEVDNALDELEKAAEEIK